MKTVSAMDVRRHLGELLDEVRLKSETVVIERAGKPIAKLCPVDQGTGESDAVSRRLRAVRELAGCYAGSSRSQGVDQWLDEERGSWGADR